MSRALTIQNLYEKIFKTFAFTGVFGKAMGEPETNGAWLVYGAEKNGKTWFSLMLAQYISSYEKVLYVSAEEGTGKGFVEACRRAGIEGNNRNLHFLEYTSIADLKERLTRRAAPKVVFLDNLTIYNDELKYGAFQSLLREHEDVLFVFVAHEEKGQPYTAAAKMCRKLAKIIVRVVGLKAIVSGRCPGGEILIDETKAALYWAIRNKKQ